MASPVPCYQSKAPGQAYTYTEGAASRIMSTAQRSSLAVTNTTERRLPRPLCQLQPALCCVYYLNATHHPNAWLRRQSDGGLLSSELVEGPAVDCPLVMAISF